MTHAKRFSNSAMFRSLLAHAEPVVLVLASTDYVQTRSRIALHRPQASAASVRRTTHPSVIRRSFPKARDASVAIIWNRQRRRGDLQDLVASLLELDRFVFRFLEAGIADAKLQFCRRVLGPHHMLAECFCCHRPI